MNRLSRTLARCGATGALVQSVDWAATPLGPMEDWPCCVAAAVEMVLSGGLPLSVVLGRHASTARLIYNDPFIAFLGPKHPAAMGRPAREVWPEIWDFFEWALRQVSSTQRPVTGKDLLLRVERGEQIEEIYATLSFSPICDESGGPCGALVCAIETTGGVVSARREHALRVIAEGLTQARTEAQLFRGVETALGAASRDVAFALLYVLDADGERASLQAAVGLAPGGDSSPEQVDLTVDGGGCWGLGRTVATRESSVIATGGGARTSTFVAACDPPRSAVVVPVIAGAREGPLGVLVVGLNPAVPFDHAYQGFVRRVAHEIATSLASVHTLEDARRRADTLAQLDRVKTAFLTNVSHEFRTPLTLVIGPLEDLLGDGGAALSPEQRTVLERVRRSAYRLLGYVTTLLDFARADVGPAAVEFEPTDLAALTAEIAGTFELVAARAGLRLVVDCPTVGEPVFVAREMWEQIVLNLISNALKHTFQGEIAVSLCRATDRVRLTVRDTGTGIPEHAVPHLFERFYRVPDAPARTREGMGVGLALVKELVTLHGGSIQVASKLGEGSTFTVEVPRGSAHLPPARVRAASSLLALRAAPPFIEDALGWLGPPPAPPAPERAARSVAAARILVAEDSAEMREYLSRLLGPTYEVVAVADGAAALASARARPPDLLVSDVVMPVLDGLGLLRAIRADPGTCDIPVVMLSGRGDESTLVDALGGGADDYLIKPFSARELRARVRTHLELARARREVGESRLKDVFLGLASHELRTPLTCLKLNVQLVHRDLEKLDPRLAARIGVLHRSIDRMTRLVDDMLSISAIAAGKLSLRQGRCDLGEICRDAASEQAQVTRRQVTLALPDAPVLVLADEDRLGQVVGNLLANALKYSSADRPVTLALRTSGREAIVTVRDEGVGISPEDQPHLFERFYRAPNVGVRSGSYVGLGLGLFLARTIVEQHGGRVWVESDVGKGSAFSFAVPLADEPGP